MSSCYHWKGCMYAGRVRRFEVKHNLFNSIVMKPVFETEDQIRTLSLAVRLVVRFKALDIVAENCWTKNVCSKANTANKVSQTFFQNPSCLLFCFEINFTFCERGKSQSFVWNNNFSHSIFLVCMFWLLTLNLLQRWSCLNGQNSTS